METVINGNSMGVAYALKKMQEIAAQSDPRTNEQRESDIAEFEAAQELGLDLWNKEEFADKSEIEFDDYEEEKGTALTLYLDGKSDELMDFLEKLEEYRQEDFEEENKEYQKALAKGVKKRNKPETGEEYVKRLIAETGIILPY